MTIELSESVMEAVDPSRCAIFLDFDGTIAEIAEEPHLATVSAPLQNDLQRLAKAVGGAVAIITGREIESIDSRMALVRLPVAGVHGLVRRSADGAVHRVATDERTVALLEKRLRASIADCPGLLIERKVGSVALHYRARPDCAVHCQSLMNSVTGDLTGIDLVHGKMVIEAKFSGGNKGRAIADFLDEHPFVGRTPIFVGDDVTDEDGFREVNQRSGISIKVGPGDSAARYRVDGVVAVGEHLRRLADCFERLGTGGGVDKEK
jgi:trehalose 6-phosphate phosphatase